ncbi:hypothetical protein [Vagococcus fluvialis]|uniref:hypothetical protein n=1 Tax=Vagococcus fluvialis TaxID=2738 RepID=UPI002890E8AD|nr:hypothetical protein [Vagococcus fluvialis]MDT2747064.1 hypothetical protein [Vagococcus fluvialis]
MAKAYLATYDLNSPGQKYDEVIGLFKGELSLAYCKYWESSFLFTSNLTPSQMIAKLKPHLDNGDKMIIVEVVDNKSGWLTQKQWDWINENIFD